MAVSKMIASVLLASRILQWSSAVIVLGLYSYFIKEGPRGVHTTYTEVISAISVVFFLPAFASAFVPGLLSQLVMAIDAVFSYLWLTAFVFAAQSYSGRRRCRASLPFGVACSKKWAAEAFVFLTFFFTFLGLFLGGWSLWYHQHSRDASPAHPEKQGPSNAPLDAPAEPAPAV